VEVVAHTPGDSFVVVADIQVHMIARGHTYIAAVRTDTSYSMNGYTDSPSCPYYHATYQRCRRYQARKAHRCAIPANGCMTVGHSIHGIHPERYRRNNCSAHTARMLRNRRSSPKPTPSDQVLKRTVLSSLFSDIRFCISSQTIRNYRGFLIVTPSIADQNLDVFCIY
jgi:hypothetical protein